jgi:hypothetical protein
MVRINPLSIYLKDCHVSDIILEPDPKKLRTWLPFLIVAFILGAASYVTDLADRKEITWQEFKRDLLEKNLVAKLTVEGKNKVIVTPVNEAIVTSVSL